MADSGSRIGRGVSAPLRREGVDYAMVEEYAMVLEHCEQILGVRGLRDEGRSGGEYPWRKRFGGAADTLRHLNIRTRSIEGDIAKVLVADAIQEWEPRADVELPNVEFSMDRRTGNIRDIKVRIRPDGEGNSPVQDVSRVITSEVSR